MGHVYRKLTTNAPMWYFRFTSETYSEAARKRMAHKTQQDLRAGVGGWEQGIGKLQLDFLVDRGLDPDDRLLDLGCGSLRAGRHFLDYLDPGNYVGMDVSPEVIRAGVELLGNDFLRESDPRLITNDDLRFREFEDTDTFEYVIANSVFTHLPREEIAECFGNIRRVLATDAVFYATFRDSRINRNTVVDAYGYSYRPEELIDLAAEHGLDARLLPEDEYPHPRRQRMLEIHDIKNRVSRPQ